MGTYNRKDHLYNKAKEEGYRSRAAYKLLELDAKYKFLHSGAKILDLGCAPGGWTQVVVPYVSPAGIVVGIDRLDMEPFSAGEFKGKGPFVKPIIIKGDITEQEMQDEVIKLAGGKVDVVLSDMSPDLTGVYFQDAARSAELVDIAFSIALKLLVPGGTIVSKIFPGSEADELFNQYKKYYKKLNRVALKSTRKTSKEFYLVGQGFQGVVE